MILVINCGTTFLDGIKKNLEKLNAPNKIITLDEIESEDLESYSGILITGAPILLTKVDMNKYLDLFQFIKTTNTPVLGICFGHQIMGLLYDAKISIGEKITDKENIEIVKDDVLFKDVGSNSPFREEHAEEITLPTGFQLLAKSKTCGNEAMKSDERILYGIQFHPEMSDEVGTTLLKNFLTICSSKKSE